MEKEDKGKFKDFTTPGKTKEYKNKVMWLHKSKAGEHLYSFIKEDDIRNAKSVIMNISEVKALLEGDVEGIKISIMPEEEDNAAKPKSG